MAPKTVYQPKAGDTAVITGAGFGGIGFDTGLLLAKRKVHITLADNDSAALGRAHEAFIAAGIAESDFATHVTDVSRPDQVLKLAESVFQSRGKVDFLHLNAGIGAKVKAYGQDIADEWQKTFDVNLFGVVNGCQAFVERMVAQVRPALFSLAGDRRNRRVLT